MRVLLYRQHVCQDGVASWMTTLAAQLQGLGVECAFWFPKIFYRPLEDFERLGPVFAAPHHAAEEILRGGYDVVHVVNSDFTAELLGLLRPAPRIVATSHGDLSDAWGRHNCFAYTAVSPDMAALNQTLTDLEVETIPNGVDCERFTPPAHVADGAPVVAWVGRSTDERKDFPRFTRVAARLAARGVRFWVADAHGASWDDLAGRDVRQVPFERWARIPAAEMPTFYRELAAHRGVLVMTSRHEGWGLAATEAAASGVPTAGPDVVGLRRAILPSVTGVLFPAGASDDEAADRVWDLLQATRRSPSVAADCVAAARSRFSAGVMARRYLEIYHRPRQRLTAATAAPINGSEPDVAGLLARLRTHRWHRAAFLSEVARTLSRTGQSGIAWRAMRRSIAVAPRSAVHPARAVRLLTTTAGLAGRLLRRAPRRDTIAAPGPAPAYRSPIPAYDRS